MTDQRIYDLWEQLEAMNQDNSLRCFDVLTEADLANLKVGPPAFAYVREVGDLFWLHGPEYWFGNVGTEEKAYSDREADRWVRMGYSGTRALILALRITHVSSEAMSALSRITREGPPNYEAADYSEYGSSYWTVVENLLEFIRNSITIEINNLTCEDKGTKLYDIVEGDMILDASGVMAFVQDIIPNKVPQRYLNRLMEQISIAPLEEGTPGLHIVNKEDKTELVQIHSERLGYVVTSRDASKGDTVIHIAAYPNSIPKMQWSADPWEWQVNESTEEVTRWGQTWEYTKSRVVRPIEGNFTFTNETWALIPNIQPRIEATLSWNNLGSPWPAGAEVTVTLEQGCPVPLIVPQTLLYYGEQPYWSDVAPVKSQYSFQPLGVYGGYTNATTILGRLLPTSSKPKLGQTESTIQGGDRIDFYNPATENWGSGFPMSQGLKHHSPARGMRPNDFIKFQDNDTMYGVTEVSKNFLENPEGCWFDRTTHPIDNYYVNVYGVAIGEQYSWYAGPDDPRNTVHMAPFYPWGSYNEYPMMVQSIASGAMTMTAPIPDDIPAGTRIHLHTSVENSQVTYSYHDPYEFKHKLALYNTVEYELGRGLIQQRLDHLDNLAAKWATAKTIAETNAWHSWMSVPYGELNYLWEEYWDPDLDVLLEDTGTDDKYGEAFRVYSERRAKLAELLNVSLPGYAQVEYMSILDYIGRGL